MGLPTAQNIISMGFSGRLFGLDDDDFTIALPELIAEHGALLSGRIGAAVYATTVEPTVTYIARAVKCLVAAELCQRRINRLANEVRQEGSKLIDELRAHRHDYLREAETMIDKIEAVAGANDDFAVGCVITSHFDDALS